MTAWGRLGVLIAAAATILGGRAAGAQEVRAEIIGALVEHRLENAGDLQREFGSAFGVGLSYPVMPWIELRGELLGGALAAQTDATDDRRFGELDLSALISPFPWIGFEIGGGSRTFTGPLGRQRWVTMRAGAELRMSFIDGRVLGTIGGALIPVAAVSGVESPSVAATGHSGILLRHRNLTARVAYRLERYDFPMESSTRRLEQLSSLSAHIGVPVPELRWPF